MAAASLKRHFLRWLGVGALACLALAAAVRFASLHGELAAAQDQRLFARLQAWPQTQAGDILSLGRRDGERLRGDPGLPPYPWPAELQPGETARYYSHAGGRFVRAAAALRTGADGETLVLQVAEPLQARWPGPRAFFAGGFGAFALGVLAMLAIAGIAAARARGWLVASLHQAGLQVPVRVAPLEVQPALDRLRELHAGERQWVEEQRRFLADAAHQLRTPLAVLRTQLQAGLASPADARDALTGMLHTVDRATGLANQLLSLTRLEQLKRAGRLESLSMAAAVREAVVELSPLLAQKRLDFALEGDDFAAPADAVMLGELLRNLLANAIHHGPAGSRMGVVLRGALPARELLVWDEGPGIDDAVKPRLFTPFGAGKGGVGLGLSICQQIGEAMGARVQLFNRMDAGRVVGVDALVVWDAPA
jgi:two-component system sensor histidine kinase TctE